MVLPTIKEEKKLFQRGFEIIAGIDEVGRGPLAGPVVAAAVVPIDKEKFLKTEEFFLKIKDSKKLQLKTREKLFDEICLSKIFCWGVGIVSEKIIDKEGILEATKLAMKKAVASLPKTPEFI